MCDARVIEFYIFNKDIFKARNTLECVVYSSLSKIVYTTAWWNGPAHLYCMQRDLLLVHHEHRDTISHANNREQVSLYMKKQNNMIVTL